MYFVIVSWNEGWKHTWKHTLGPFDSYEEAERIADMKSKMKTRVKPVAYVCKVVETCSTRKDD